MNKKGFTLVEILAVLVILSLIFVIIYPNIQDAFDNSKKAISELNKKQIEDSVKIIVDEVIYCNMSDETKNILGNNCNDAVTTLVNGKDIDISALELDNNNSQKCTGTINVKIDRETYKAIIDMSKVTCE